MERPIPCADCKEKLCEHYLNEDGECIQPNTLAQLITLGGEGAADLVQKLVEKNNDLPTPRP